MRLIIGEAHYLYLLEKYKIYIYQYVKYWPYICLLIRKSLVQYGTIKMKNTEKLLCLSMLSLALSGCVVNVHAQSADVTLEETLSLDASALERFDIEAGAGSLIIKGDESATEINVEADIRTTEDKDFTLELDQSGDTARLVAKHNSTMGYWKGSSPSIDLTITMPANLMLDIEDGSGEIKVSNINNTLKLKDGSGSASIENIVGNVQIDDGSGELTVRNVQGNLELDDGSGGLTVEDIQGDIDLDDGSGSLTVSNVKGDVEVNDGSGGLKVTDVTGKVTIDDGSGGIDVRRAGSLEIIESGSGGLSIKEIEGEVDIDS